MKRYLVVLACTLGCDSPADKAGDVALAFGSIPPHQTDRTLPLVCAEDREAFSSKELLLHQPETMANSPGLSAADRTAQVAPQITVASVVVEPSGTATTATLKVSSGDVDSEQVVNLRLEQDTWCVVTGWAEAKRLAMLVDETESLLDQVKVLREDWRVDEASARLAEAEARGRATAAPHSTPWTSSCLSAWTDHREAVMVNVVRAYPCARRQRF